MTPCYILRMFFPTLMSTNKIIFMLFLKITPLMLTNVLTLPPSLRLYSRIRTCIIIYTSKIYLQNPVISQDFPLKRDHSSISERVLSSLPNHTGILSYVLIWVVYSVHRSKLNLSSYFQSAKSQYQCFHRVIHHSSNILDTQVSIFFVAC